ncbi:MAG: hypothetical protein HY717_03070 [Planctomycetes bacterium]|nr:hypothetical protein [Planctomycetota bacterium]
MPSVYDHNPGLDIPEEWWSEEAAALRKARAEEPGEAGAFRWEGSFFRYAGGKTLRPDEKEEASLSQDGRYLAIYPRGAQKGGPPARLAFRIIDGASGEEWAVGIATGAQECFVQAAAWQVLCLETPGPEELRRFRPAERHHWYDPW